MKKGQGLSLNTIIIAAIVLIVLIVLWAIFTGRMGTFTTGVKETEADAKTEAEKFLTGGIQSGFRCTDGANIGDCESSCDGDIISLSSLPAEERCATGLICCGD